MLGDDFVFGVPHGFAPDKIFRRQQPDIIVFNKQIDGLRRAAFKDEHVPASKLQISAKLPTRVRTRNGIRQRPFGNDRVTATR